MILGATQKSIGISRRNAGVTMVEVIVATAILGVIIVIVGRFQAQSMDAVKSNTSKYHTINRLNSLQSAVDKVIAERNLLKDSGSFRDGIQLSATKSSFIVSQLKQNSPAVAEEKLIRVRTLCKDLRGLKNAVNFSNVGCLISCGKNRVPVIDIGIRSPGGSFESKFQFPRSGENRMTGAVGAAVCIDRSFDSAGNYYEYNLQYHVLYRGKNKVIKGMMRTSRFGRDFISDRIMLKAER